MRVLFNRVLVATALWLIAPVVVAQALGGEVLISNNKASVNRAEFEAEISRIPEQDRTEFLASAQRIGKVLEELLVTNTLAAEARENGLDKREAIVAQTRLAVDKVLAKARLDGIQNEAVLPDFTERAKELYKLNPERYSDKASVHASHILISTKARSREEALKRAAEARGLLLSGKSFEEIALEYSDDPSAKENKGDLGYFSADRMVKAFSDAAFAMKAGEISDLVETKFGFHIIRVEDKKPAILHSFDSVKDGIIREVQANYRADLRKGKVSSIRADKDVKINEEGILSLKTVLPPIDPVK